MITNTNNIVKNMDWNEKEELKGLLAANKRKPVIREKKSNTDKLKRNTLKSSLKC